jgi:hypothetical protein
MLAYINDEEASLLKALGGAGKPVHGVPAFYDEGDDYGGPGGDQSAGPDGQQGTGNNNAGGNNNDDRDPGRSGPGDMGASNNTASNTDDAYGNQQTGQGSSDPDANDPRNSDWDNWAQTVGQNYPDTNNNMTEQDQDLVDAIQSMVDNGRVNLNSDSTNQQLSIIGSGLIPGMSVDDRLEALEDLGRRVAAGEQEDEQGNKSYDFSFLGGANFNDWKNYNTSDDITNKDMAEAFAKGFNSQTGAPGWDPLGFDLNVGKGWGGTRLGMLPNGDLTVQSGGSYAAQNLANAGLMIGGAYVGDIPGALLGNTSINMGNPLGGWNKFGPNAPQQNNLNVNFDALNFATGQVIGPVLNKTIGKGIGQKIYDQTNNPALASMGAGASVTAVNKAIKDNLAEAGVDGVANIASIDMNTGQMNPNVNTGKGTATKGTATTTVQSDLSSDPAKDGSVKNSASQASSSSFSVGQDQPFSKGSDYSNAGITYGGYEDDLGASGKAVDATSPNANGMGFGSTVSTGTTSNTTNNNNNNDGSQPDNKWQNLQNDIKKIIEDGQNTTGQSYLSPISYLSPATSGRGFGNYLTQGKNRDFGSATFRASTKGEIDRSKRRGGFGNIMFA